MKQGTQTTVPATSGSNALLHIFGGLNLVTGEVVATFARQRNSDSFIAFLEQLMLHAYPQQAVYLVLDNASFHRSASAQAAIALFEPRLQIFWLPPYSPELNPIEPYWRYLKTQAYGNRTFTNLTEVEAAVGQVLARQNDLHTPDRYHLSN